MYNNWNGRRLQLCQAVPLQLVNQARAPPNLLVQLQQKRVLLDRSKWQRKPLRRRKYPIPSRLIRLLKERKLVTKSNQDSITPILHHKIVIKLILMQVR